MSGLVRQLAALLGLDDETVQTQVWPHLESIKDRRKVQEYLQSLLSSSRQDKLWIDSYLNARFPPPPPQPQPQQATPWGSKPRPSPSSTPKLAPPAPQSASSFEKAFAGGGGKVYVKNRDEDEWGMMMGAKKGKKAAVQAATPEPTAAAAPPPAAPGLSKPSSSAPASAFATPAPTPKKKPLAANNTRGGRTASPGIAATITLSETASVELLEIDRALASFDITAGGVAATKDGKGKSRAFGGSECFCQARLHPLSVYTPLCPTCGLVLCALNPPISPCPSCTTTLLTPLQSTSFVADLNTRREAVLAREKDRNEREEREREAERRAIRFPELGMNGGKGRVEEKKGYANMAGSGPGLEDKIERAYAEGVTASGARFGGVDVVEQSGPAKVLRLDGKKVKVVTTVKKKKVEKAVEDGGKGEGEEQREKGWVDESDDGWRKRMGLARGADLEKGKGIKEKKEEEEDKASTATLPRPFENDTPVLPGEYRPEWVEETAPPEPEPTVEETLKSKAGFDGGNRERVVPGAKVDGPKKSRKKKTKTGGGGAEGAEVKAVQVEAGADA
ncbi:zinc finger, C2HC5-type protein [Pseudohyphozyma bogoriensis]|nr:zinc finger, C2HC5-type protein [Pseudohyphozyma bogoriensis]